MPKNLARGIGGVKPPDPRYKLRQLPLGLYGPSDVGLSEVKQHRPIGGEGVRSICCKGAIRTKGGGKVETQGVRLEKLIFQLLQCGGQYYTLP